MPIHAQHRLQSTRQLLAYGLLALGLQAVQATNGAFLAPYLESLGTDPFWISVILSLDPITCIFAVPWLNGWSDRLNSRWGRRLPFIAVGLLLAAASMASIAVASGPGQIAAGMVLLYVGTSAVWGPYRATLGEIVAPERHTTATGLQGLCQGIGTLVAMGGGGLLLAYGPGWPFWQAALVLIIGGVITVGTMHRPARLVQVPPRPTTRFRDMFRQARDLHWLLAAQTCWWAAMSGVIAFAVLFVTHEILGIPHLSASAGHGATRQAVGILLLFAVVSMLAAIPCGRLANSLGKVRVLRWGLLVLLVGMIVALLATDLTSLRLGIVCCGIGFAAVQVIPLALYTELQPPGHEGAVMTLLGVFTDAPLMVGYLLEGWLIASTGSYRVPFALGSVLILAAWICLGRLRPASSTVVAEF
jgi:MFS family permease